VEQRRPVQRQQEKHPLLHKHHDEPDKDLADQDDVDQVGDAVPAVAAFQFVDPAHENGPSLAGMRRRAAAWGFISLL